MADLLNLSASKKTDSLQLQDAVYDSTASLNKSQIETLKNRLDDVERQKKYIYNKLYHSEKTINRISHYSNTMSKSNSFLDKLTKRIFESEKQNKDILDKLNETEKKMNFLTQYHSISAGNYSLIDNLTSRIEAIELQNKSIQGKLHYAETKMRNLERYSRRENIEIIGIPDSVKHRDLEDTVIKILCSINVPIVSYDIAACHRLTREASQRSGNVIVRFVHRQISIESLRKRKRLKYSPYKYIFNNNLFIVENLSIL